MKRTLKELKAGLVQEESNGLKYKKLFYDQELERFCVESNLLPLKLVVLKGLTEARKLYNKLKIDEISKAKA